MVEQGGRVTFARFMELALTHPTDGYYSRTETLLGPRGHFSTAPRLSQAFNGAVGRLLEELIDATLRAGAAAAPQAGSPGFGPVATPGAALGATSDAGPGVTLIELGAGEADLAEALLERWQTDRPDLRERLTYTIVEVGERLRAQQCRILAKAIDRGWRVAWAETVAEALAGAGVGVAAAVVVGNEFFDALPVHVIDVRGAAPAEAWVEVEAAVAETPAGSGGQTTAAGRSVREVWGALSEEAEAELQRVLGTADANAFRALTRDGIIELRPSAGELVGRLAAGPPAVCLLSIDYGEWFAGPGCAQPDSLPLPPYRSSLRGYFRHQMVQDPYLRVGRQDLTADVDFRALDLHGRSAGFETVLFSTVAALLLANGGRERLDSLRREAGTMALGASAAGGPSPAPLDDGGSSSSALDADREATVLEGLLDAQGLGGAFKVMLQVRG